MQQTEQQRYQLDQQAAQCMRELAFALAKFYGISRNCLNCNHWAGNQPASGKPQGCLLWQGQLPPLPTIVHGCKSWEADEIPF